MDKYSEKLQEFLLEYAHNQYDMHLQLALRDILGDLQIVAKNLNLDFQRALDTIDGTYEDDMLTLAILHKEQNS